MATRFRNAGVLAILASALVVPAVSAETWFKQELKTQNSQEPQITLYLRLPPRINGPGLVNGIIACPIFSGHAKKIETQMKSGSGDTDVWNLEGFADDHKMAMLYWDFKGLWNPQMNNEDIPTLQDRVMDQSFDGLAKTWEKGVQGLCAKYNLPENDYLLYGACGAGQWAHRLALRKPKRFLAVHIDVTSSYDKPTQDGNRCLWLVTATEAIGYANAKRFYAESRNLGYPMIFKNSGNTVKLREQFFEYALSLKPPDKSQNAASKTSPSSRFPDFQQPPFIGDYINQEVYSSGKADWIPEAQRVALPTRELAEAWGEVVE